MKTHSWVDRSAALLCLAATLHFNWARAQDPPKAAETTPAARAAAKSGSASAYDLVIQGRGLLLHNGTHVTASLGNVVGVLREIWPEANIVLAPEASNIHVGDLKLHSTRELGEALEALRVASGYRFEWRKGLPNAGGGTDPATGLPMATAGGESPLYILDLGVNSQGNPLERARRMVEVFNMSGYLEHLKEHPGVHDQNEVDRTLDEIQKTVLMTVDSLKDGELSPGDLPRFQFHPGTGLLIVTGPPDAIEVAHKVVTALTGQPSSGESVLLGDANQRAEEAARRRYSRLRPGAPAPGQAAPNNPPAAPANPAPPPR